MAMRHDPVREIEISERSWTAMSRESEQIFMELHARVIDARVTARKLALDRLLGRIDSVISAA